MTTSPDGVTTCDRCGADCGNGGVSEALIVSDLDATEGMVRNLHLCRTTITITGHDPDTGAAITTTQAGCDGVVLDASAMAQYLTSHEMYDRPERTLTA